MAKETTPPPSYEAVSAAAATPPAPLSITPPRVTKRPVSSPSSPSSSKSWPSSRSWSSPSHPWPSWDDSPASHTPLPRKRPASSSLSAPRPPDLTALTSLTPAAPAADADRSGPRSDSGSGSGPGAGAQNPPVPSMLQPRVAVVLNVPQPWHPWLFALRLCSILPALWWGLPSLLRLLLYFLPGPPDQFMLVKQIAVPGSNIDVLQSTSISSCSRSDGEAASAAAAAAVLAAPYAITETALATIWCFACGYLAFFFTDCLMSRWLINYTPQATVVRLLSINAVNAYLTLNVLSITGGFQDPRLLLPGWVSIATVRTSLWLSSPRSRKTSTSSENRIANNFSLQSLTICYHVTHQKINIRKETITSVNVFSIASYLTMVVLLAHMQMYQPDYPTMPIVTTTNRLWQSGKRLVASIQGAGAR
ncbi:N-glycosylation domain-containing protein [Trichoderma gracile]